MKFHQVECHTLLRQAGEGIIWETPRNKSNIYFTSMVFSLEMATIKKSWHFRLYWKHADCKLHGFIVSGEINAENSGRYFLEDSTEEFLSRSSGGFWLRTVQKEDWNGKRLTYCNFALKLLSSTLSFFS